MRLLEETASSLKSPEQKKRLQVHTPHCARDVLKAHKEVDIFNMHSSSMFANQLYSSSSQEVEDGELVISSEKVSDDFDGSGELPEVSSQVPQGHEIQGSRLNARRSRNDRSGWDLNTNMETWDQLSDKVAHARIKMGKGSRTVGVLVRQKNDTVVQLVRAKESLKISSNELPKDTTAIDSDRRCRASPCKEADGGSEVSVAGKVPVVCQTEVSGKLKPDVPVLANSGSKVGEEDYERQGLGSYKSTEKIDRQASLQRIKTEDGIELAEEPEGEEHVDYGNFDCREGDYAGLEMDDRSPLLEEETYWNGEHTSGSPSFGERNTRLESGEGERKQVDASTSGRVRLSGWDQLPEGFESAEEALKAAQEVLSRRGRTTWVNFGGRGLASSAHNFNSGRANKRESFKGFGDRYCNDSFCSGESFKHTGGLDDKGDVYNPSRGRAFGRTGAGGGHGRGCHHGWADNGQDDCNDKWGQGRHRSSKFSSPVPTNAAALAVERSGFVVGCDGTLSRGSRSSRGTHSMFVNSHGNRGPTIGGRARSDDMDKWLSVSKRVDSRFDRNGGRSSNMDFGERGVRHSAGTGFAGRMADRDAQAGHGFGDRYGGSSYSSQTVELRRSKSPDYPYTNYRRSSPPQPESRMKRSNFSPSSPERSSRSKFYPPSARNQRSPPPFSKFSHDNREGETFRERDSRRPVPRYGAPARTSPHVVHGSSLMDERDMQALAGTRSSSGARGGLNSFRDVSPELQRSRRAEGEDHTGSMSKDSENGKNNPSMRAVVYRRDRIRDDGKKREPYRSLSRSTSLHRCSSSRDGFDEVASRRHCQ